MVTTGDLKEDYEVIGPVYLQISNKGFFSSALSELTEQYSVDIAQMKKQGLLGEARTDWGFLYGEFSVEQSDFEKAFFIAVQELKKRAELLGAHAVISMRQDIDLDTDAFQYFYLQMYGTAVRFKCFAPSDPVTPPIAPPPRPVPPVAASKPRYYVSSDGEDSGPHSLEEMRRFRQSGRLTDEALVFREGDKEWQPTSMFSEICFEG
jgi:hypothetical protein